jgi:hypothetical protein
MSSTRVQFHFNKGLTESIADILEIDAGENLVSIEFIPKLKQENEKYKTLELALDLEVDEIDALCSVLQMFKRRVEAGWYPESEG